MTPETTCTEGWRRGERTRQCPLTGAPPVGGGLRRRGRWRSASLAADDRPDLRSAKQRDRPRDRHPEQMGVGYGLGPEGRVCAFGGYGGSLMVIDVDRRMTFAYAMNKMAPGGGPIAAALAQRVSKIVKSTSP